MEVQGHTRHIANHLWMASSYYSTSRLTLTLTVNPNRPMNPKPRCWTVALNHCALNTMAMKINMTLDLYFNTYLFSIRWQCTLDVDLTFNKIINNNKIFLFSLQHFHGSLMWLMVLYRYLCVLIWTKSNLTKPSLDHCNYAEHFSNILANQNAQQHGSIVIMDL